jgi:hypothetical protein
MARIKAKPTSKRGRKPQIKENTNLITVDNFTIEIEHDYADSGKRRTSALRKLLYQAIPKLKVNSAIYISAEISNPGTTTGVVQKVVREIFPEWVLITRKVIDNDGVLIGARIIRKS